MILLKFGGITMPIKKEDKSLEDEDEEDVPEVDSEDADGDTISDDDEI